MNHFYERLGLVFTTLVFFHLSKQSPGSQLFSAFLCFLTLEKEMIKVHYQMV